MTSKYLWLKGKKRRVHILGPDGRTLCQIENSYLSDKGFLKASKRVLKSELFPVQDQTKTLCGNCALIQGYKKPVEMQEAEYPF